MKKFLAIFAIVAITGSLAANAAESKIQNYVDNLISPITKKEKQIRAYHMIGSFIMCYYQYAR